MKTSIRPRVRVIVLGWSLEPADLMLHAIDISRDMAYVGVDEAKRPLGFPLDHVFVFSDETMQRLRASYDSGDKAATEAVYADVKSSCIKYQINLDSLHDQERVANPCGPEARSG